MKYVHEPKVLNINSNTVQSKNVVQKNKILNIKMNHQAKKASAIQELKYTQKLQASVNKVALQKKKMLTAKKARASLDLDVIEQTLTAPKTKNLTNVSNIQTQARKPKFQEKMTVAQKTNVQDKLTVIQKVKTQDKPIAVQKAEVQEKLIAVQKTDVEEKKTTAQKIIAQVKPTAIQRTKVENDISLNNKAPENNNCTLKIKNQNNNKAAQDTKPQVNSPKTAPEMVHKITPSTQENKNQETVKDVKVSASNSAGKQSADQSQTELSSREICELDPLLARAVEEELQDIMIQVWQELPDDPMEEADRVAVEKLRTEAGDDLRRVLGLNITKRLLNVYNNLFVKIQFTCRPQIGCLTSFLYKYHINKFKRIDKNSNTFAAELDTIEDFDNLCAVKEFMCGEAKVTITPCYKFTQCPEKLKTIYDDTYFYEDAAQEHVVSPKSKKQVQKAKVMVPSNDNIVKLSNKAENIEAKLTDKSNNTEVNKPANSVRVNSKDIRNDSTVVDKENTTDTPKKNSVETKSKDNKIIVNVTSEKEMSKDVAKDNIGQCIIKDKLESDEDELDSGVPECQMEGEDELDDEDILALMSEGVVLDECSGSDDEN